MRLHSIRIGKIFSESESRCFDSGYCCCPSGPVDRRNDCLLPISDDSSNQYDDNHDIAANYYNSNSYWYDNYYNPSNDGDNPDANRYNYNHDSSNYHKIDNCIRNNFSDGNHDHDSHHNYN